MEHRGEWFPINFRSVVMLWSISGRLKRRSVTDYKIIKPVEHAEQDQRNKAKRGENQK